MNLIPCKLTLGPLITFCFALLANVAKLCFSTYLPYSPHIRHIGQLARAPSLLCLVGECSKIAILAIFAKFAKIFPFLLLRAFQDKSQAPRWLDTQFLSHGLESCSSLGGFWVIYNLSCELSFSFASVQFLIAPSLHLNSTEVSSFYFDLGAISLCPIIVYSRLP